MKDSITTQTIDRVAIQMCFSSYNADEFKTAEDLWENSTDRTKNTYKVLAKVAVDTIINTPITEDFIQGLKNEIQHQKQRSGASHDADKSLSNWVRLIHHVSRKVSEADWDQKPENVKHNIIRNASALFGFHRTLEGK
jgi:hypothetical protein